LPGGEDFAEGRSGAGRTAAGEEEAVRRVVEEDRKPLTVWRALRAAEFWLLLVAAIAAVFRVPWWVTVPLVMGGLSISSLPKYVELWPRARAVGAELEWWKTVGLSSFNNLAAACGAHVLGVFIGWFWGVP
jgi:hypothetical protein